LSTNSIAQKANNVGSGGRLSLGRLHFYYDFNGCVPGHDYFHVLGTIIDGLVNSLCWYIDEIPWPNR
jgi:hypothetical protein